VSTCTLSMVAQLLVPGTQTVTLVVSMLRVRPGAVVTAIGWVLGVLDWGTEPGGGMLASGVDAAGAVAGLDAAVAGAADDAEDAGAAADASLPELLPPPPPPQPASALVSAPAITIRDTMRMRIAAPVSSIRPP
jgi:hypothetical protein